MKIWLCQLYTTVVYLAQVELVANQTCRCFVTGTLLKVEKIIISDMHFHLGSSNTTGSEHKLSINEVKTPLPEFE